jgi:tetratricopeptide (TPR) repeat protein
MADDFAYDVFISRRGSQSAVAQEVLDALVAGGWDRERILVQDKDLPTGTSFLDWMHQNLPHARHLIVVLSHDYDDSVFTRRYEFLTFLQLPNAATHDRRVIVLRADECDPPGLMQNFVYQDLANEREPTKRRQRILDAAEGRVRPIDPGPPIFGGVPGRPAHFAGREQLLDDLRAKLTAQPGHDAQGGTVAVGQALAGLGGVGKTMLAAAYARQHARAYQGVWWAPAEQRALLTASLAELAGRLDAKWEAAQDQDAAARHALDLIRRRGALVPWLLIYDNVETPGDIEGLEPEGGAHLLVTTRFQTWPGEKIDVGTFDRPTSVAFLQERAGRADPDGADRLADKLGDLPLALDHAAALCAEAALTFDEYAQHLDAFLPEKPESAGYHGRRDAEATVHGTFTTAIQRAEADCPEAGELIELLSVLGAEPVPLDLFDAALPLPKRAKAVRALSRVALVQSASTETGEPAVTLHRLVARVARSRTEAAGRLDTAVMRATEILEEAFPDDAYREPARWPRCAALLPHVLGLRNLWTEERATIAAARLAMSAGGYLKGRASFDSAEMLVTEGLTIARRVLPPDDTEIATFANNLAFVLKNRGKLDEAEPLYREAVEIGETTSDRNKPWHAARLNNLASLLEQRGHFDAAEPLYREAIKIGEAALGRSHRDILPWLNNLASLLAERSKLDEAETLYREAIQSGETAYGRNHPVVAVWLNNFAGLLEYRGKLDEAEPLSLEALATIEATLGAEHPNTVKVAHNYAHLLDATGRGDEADALRRRYPDGGRA